ncbi:hypothetical protein [Breznakiella homolactica]|uniref:Uncharacterized protein n=1 Tax=Breznakiella homolactica TaxID=2798577 RepID=A0A7T7XPL6_9SPIR|nr:hypothetical protein [Breznakiella homolactica]QQO10151.1 hypothetical protein JFL75_04315 [Breznakiella homolactica]
MKKKLLIKGAVFFLVGTGLIVFFLFRPVKGFGNFLVGFGGASMVVGILNISRALRMRENGDSSG